MAQIIAFFDEGRVEFLPGFVARRHNMAELRRKFHFVDPQALIRIVRGPR